MTEEQKQKLEKKLWDIANELRGKMDADEFRDYILGFIFYKYLSEKQYFYANELLIGEAVTDYAQVTDVEDIDAIREESLQKLGYFLKPDELFSAIAVRGNAVVDGQSNFILEDLAAILANIEKSTMGTDSEDDFNNLLEDIDLGSTKLGRTVEARNTLIAKILAHLDKIDFELNKVDSDVLGDAYEYLIGQFASGAGKKAGEFYTPQQVSKVLAKIVTEGKTKIKSAYDPTCGSGSLLLRIAKEADVGAFYGQELNRTTYNLARMNMILHDVHFKRFNIQQNDTLEEPEHADMRFEAVVANPPFSAKWKGKDNPLNETDDRFSQYGALAPTSKADFAFVQHMIHQLADNGTAAIVLPHGVLFRGAAEAKIRRYIIEEQNYLDAVIGLPANLFYGTSIPACILVLKKCRVHSENILFIDASAEFDKVGNQNALSDAHVAKILDTYRTREPVEKYAHMATMDEIAENDFNLNIPRYVDTFEEEEPIDLAEVAQKLKALDAKMEETDATIAVFCRELNLPIPAGTNASLLRAYKKGCMQQIFSQHIRFKRGDGTDFPDWEEKRLGRLATVKTGSRDTKDRKSDGKYPFFVRSDTIEGIDTFAFDGEAVLTSGDGVGVGKNIHYVNGRFDYHQRVYAIYAFNTALLGRFFFQFFRENFLKRVMRLSAKNSVDSVRMSMIADMPVPVPHPDEQRKIADFLSAIDAKIDLVAQEIDAAQSFKKGLLQQMFV